MARSWNKFHARPHEWEWNPPAYHLESSPATGATDGADHYWAVTSALIRSKRKIQTFELGEGYPHGIPSHVFDRSQVKSLSFYGFDIVAFSGLKELRLSIACYGDEKTPEHFPNMDGLRFLLGSMQDLEVLDLDLPAEPEDKPTFYHYKQVFPQDGQWNHLTSLSLSKFASSAVDFLNLLTRRTPNLSDLHLDMIGLLGGTWEGVIECMMQSMHLANLDIDFNTQFWHCGGTEFLIRTHLDIGEVEEYVENGGRHPCLRSDQPDSAAQNYITEDIQEFCKPLPSNAQLWA